MDTTQLHKKLKYEFPFVLNWLKKSIDCHNGNGSSSFFSRYRHPLSGWSPAYPETTGYLIPTLFDYARLQKNEELADYALQCADWLLTVQRPSGGFPSNYADNPNLSVFNTAQILFGLLRAFQETQEDKYATACKHAYLWLLAGLEDGIWEKHNYVEGYIPSYYTRVIWPMLLVAQTLKLKGINRLQEITEHFSEKINDNFSIANWSFTANTPAFTHTIAYTIRGFLECAILLNSENLLSQTQKCMEAFLAVKTQNGKTAGSYDEEWKGDYSYTCVTGLYQSAIICFRLHHITKVGKWKLAAIEFMKEASPALPNHDPLTDSYAISGSLPLWGKYMKFKYPNWAAKFYLDAVFFLKDDIFQ